MKLILSAAFILAAGTAFAGPFGLPDHEKNGYRDTGCDPAFQVQILNDDGKYLYSNNPTCPTPPGATDVLGVEEPEEPECRTTDGCKA
jgi:hypothetical protein